MDKLNQFYSPDEILKMGIFPWNHPRTIARLITNGEIKGVKRGKGVGTRYYVRGEELQKYYNKLIKSDGQKGG